MISQNILIKAITDGDLDIIKQNMLLYNDMYEHIYVYTAACNGHLHILKYFHEIGINILYESIMCDAAKNGYLNIIKYMHYLGISIINIYGTHALRNAVVYKHHNVMLYLLKNGTPYPNLIGKQYSKDRRELKRCMSIMISKNIKIHNASFSDIYGTMILQDLYDLQNKLKRSEVLFHKKLVDQCSVSYDIIISFT
jgi:hypothetical protein